MTKTKYSNEKINNICNSKGLIFIDIETAFCNGRNRKIVNFICNSHRDKGIQSRPLEKIVDAKKPCQYCNHSLLKETFKEEMSAINPDIEILSNYVNWNTKIRCRCKIDGYEWYGRVSVLLYGGGCKICGHKKRWDSRGRITTKNFIDKMKTINSNIEIIGEYKDSHSLIKCKCKIDGYEWESIACNLLNKSAGCSECAKRRVREIEAMPHEEFVRRLSNLNTNIEVLDRYINASEKKHFKCLVHNTVFITSPRTFLYKGGRGCPFCNQSSGEKRMISILEKRGLQIKQQYSFEDCKHINRLRFDGYDENNKIAYEYQGQQHYQPIDFAGKGSEWADNEYKKGLIRDKIKQDYCKEHMISLIQVPYWEFDNMYNFLDEEIKKIS